MRCRLCGEAAGWLKRTCGECGRLLAVCDAQRGEGMRRLLQALVETGIPRERIERFLDRELVPGGGSVRDQIAADMANQLLGALGRQASQTAAGTKVLRDRGDWRKLDQRPEDDS